MRLQHPRSVLGLLLALVVSLLAVVSAANAATKPSVSLSSSCVRPTTMPGHAVSCSVNVNWEPGLPSPSGTIALSAPSYKGTVSPTTCVVDGGTLCEFSYTPKGTGSTSRTDTITAIYSGDTNWASGRITAVVGVRTQPIPIFGTGCNLGETTPGVTMSCFVYLADSGEEGAGEPTGTVAITVPASRGSVTPTSCTYVVGGWCYFDY